MVGVVPALLAGTGFAIFQLINRRALAGVDVYRGTAVLLAVGGAVLGAVSLVLDGPRAAIDVPIGALLFCAAAGFVHFFCGWTFLGMSQVRLGAARAGILIGTVPLFGALIAAVTLDEPLGPRSFVGLALVVAGVGVVVSARGVGDPIVPGATTAGLLAGLATAGCWSASPYLIRRGLEGVPSPITGAAIGMVACAIVYALAVLATSGRASTRKVVTSHTRKLLGVAGVAVALSIWMQWTAFDLLPVAVVLALLQITPVLVVILAARLAGDGLGPARVRVFLGAAITVSGSLVLILTG